MTRAEGHLGSFLMAKEEYARYLAQQKNAEQAKFVVNDPEVVICEGSLLVAVLSELISNCLEQGANNIIVDIRPGLITVRDDVCHQNPEEVLNRVNSHFKDWPDRSTKEGIGGMGVVSSREVMEEFSGSLEYRSTRNNRIIAIGKWDHLKHQEWIATHGSRD